MPKPVAIPSPTRSALLAAALLLAPVAIVAQGRSAPAGRPESVVVTAPTVRVRTAPYMNSLSIDDLPEGMVLRLAADDYQSKDWYGVILDGRVAFLPRSAAAIGSRSMRAGAPAEPAVVQAGAPTPPSSVIRPSREPSPASWAAPATPATPAAPAAPAAPAVVAAASPRVASVQPPPSHVAPAPAPAADAAPAVPSRDRAPEPAKESRDVAARSAGVAPALPAPAPTAAAPAAGGPSTHPTGEPPRAAMRFPSLRLTLGLLGTATIVKSTTGAPTTAHVSGASFVGIRYRTLGVYVAPEMGQGAGYKSQMMGGGASLDLIDLHALRITALGGVTTYAETDTSAAPVTNRVQGTSVGGIASLPFFGPLRLAYRGQYVMGQASGVPFHFTRQSIGLVF